MKKKGFGFRVLRRRGLDYIVAEDYPPERRAVPENPHVLPISIPSARQGAPSLLCAAMLCFTGCSNRYIFEEFEAKYQAPEVPTQFATGSKGWRLAGHFSYNNQGTMDIARRDTMWNGTSYPGTRYFHRQDVPESKRDSFLLLDERYRFQRSGALIGLMGLYQGRHWFAGLAGGMALPDTKRFHIGVLGGYTQFFGSGRWAPLISGGIFLNAIEVAGHGWSYAEGIPIPVGEYSGPPPGEYEPYRQNVTIKDWEMPIKLGVLYRAHPGFQPYLLFYGTTLSTWPRESEDQGRFQVDDSGLGVGIRSEAYRDLILSLEGSLMDYSGPMDYEGVGAKISFSAELAFGS